MKLSIDSPSFAEWRRRENILEAFEAAWKRGEQPRPEDFLPPGYDDNPPSLLIELVRVDVEYRRQASLPIRKEDYAERFPQLQFVMEEIFPPGPDTSADLPSTVAGNPTGAGKDPEENSAWANISAMLPPKTEPRAPLLSGAGQRLGKYEIRQPLGGGQGSAFLAFDPDLKRHVFLKLYPEGVAAGQQATVMREGQALARVRSPFVAQCYGIERDGGQIFLVMEYIPGQNLRERHRSRPLGVAAALEVIAQLAEGLAAVHACGLLHRDLKPANVIIGDDDKPRLVDFGLAATLASEALHGLSGTLPYMAPEQARGQVERIDPRSDVFGLGAILYELLTGQPPHPEKDFKELLAAAQAGDVVPPKDLNPSLPAAVNDLCMKCLAKDPNHRFSSSAELRDAIRRCQRRPWGRSRWFLPAAALLVLLGVAFWVNRPGPDLVAPPPPDKLARHPDGRLLRRTFDLQAELLGAVPSQNGNSLLVAGDTVRLRLSVERDCYVGVSLVDDQGNVTLLFPNEFDKDHIVRKGQPRLIPPEGAKYDLQVTPSKGPEYVHVFATTKHWEPIPGQRSGPFDLFTTPKERSFYQEWLHGLGIEDDERGIKVVERQKRGLPEMPVSEAIVRFQVLPRKGQ